MRTAAIREYVREQCRSGDNVFGPSFFEEHLQVVADYGRRLGERLGADLEVVELAAYLHDLSAVRDATTLRDQPQASAQLARQILADHGYASVVIERVARCIASHSTPVDLAAGRLEEAVVSNADAIAQIVRPAYWFYFAFAVRRLNFEEGRQWLSRLVESKWSALADPAKELAAEGYRRAALVLEASPSAD